MKKRFIVLVDSSNNTQKEQFIEYLKYHKIAFWHYINNSWLLITNNENINANKIRDTLINVFDNEYNLVFEVKNTDEIPWSGFGPSGEETNMFKWLKNVWGKN